MTVAFDEERWTFLDTIAGDNTKATFDANRDRYRNLVVAPSAAFVDALGALLPERVHSGLRAEAEVGRSLFRINRDTRFSRDKTHLDFVFWIGDGPPREQPASDPTRPQPSSLGPPACDEVTRRTGQLR